MSKEQEYTPFTKQLTLYINSDDRDFGTATNFNITIPNSGFILPNTLLNLTVAQFGSSFGNPLVNAVEVNPIQLRSSIGSTNIIDSHSKNISDILIQIPRSVTGANDFYIYNNFDKTYFSIRTNEFFGKSINFRVTDNNENVVTGLTNVYFIIQIYY